MMMMMTFMDTPSGRFLCVYSRYVSAVLPVRCFNVRKWKYVLLGKVIDKNIKTHPSDV